MKDKVIGMHVDEIAGRIVESCGRFYIDKGVCTQPRYIYFVDTTRNGTPCITPVDYRRNNLYVMSTRPFPGALREFKELFPEKKYNLSIIKKKSTYGAVCSAVIIFGFYRHDGEFPSYEETFVHLR